MNGDCRVTDAQMQAILEVLQVIEIGINELAEMISAFMYTVQDVIEVVAEMMCSDFASTVEPFSEVVEETHEVEFSEQQHTQQWRTERKQRQLIEQRYRVKIKRYKRAQYDETIYRPP